MKQFDFNVYKGNSKYVSFFDEYIKENGEVKKDLFKKLDISDSSYNRLRGCETNIGNTIINLLSSNYNLLQISNDSINKLSNLITKIYNNMNYRIFDSYDSDLKIIDKMIKDNSIMFPILYLIKLFMKVNVNLIITRIRKEDIELYNIVKRYEKFYTNDLLEILNFLSVIFEDELTLDMCININNNPMTYHVLSLRYYLEEKYEYAYYYAEKAKNILIDESNYKRLIMVNRVIIDSLLNLNEFDKALDYAQKNKLSLMALNFNDEISIYDNYIAISFLGLRRYKDIINLLFMKKDLSELSTIETICYIASINMIISKHNIYDDSDNINNIESLYKGLDKKMVVCVNSYLYKKDLNILNELGKNGATKSLIRVLRNI